MWTLSFIKHHPYLSHQLITCIMALQYLPSCLHHFNLFSAQLHLLVLVRMVLTGRMVPIYHTALLLREILVSVLALLSHPTGTLPICSTYRIQCLIKTHTRYQTFPILDFHGINYRPAPASMMSYYSIINFLHVIPIILLWVISKINIATSPTIFGLPAD